MKKKILFLAVLLLPLCSCVKNSNESTGSVQDSRTKQDSTSSDSAIKGTEIQNIDDNENFDGDLPDYVEMNGRIYRIHSMKPRDYEKIKAKIRAERGNSNFASEKDEVLHLSNRKITLIESERVPERVVNISRSDVPPISEFDRVAMQMVGKYVPASFKNDRIYHGYMKFFDREWDRLEKNSLGHVSSWAAANIASKISSPSETLFYPFGGPDIAYALAFYPNASEYVLVGLEPVGRFKDVRRAMRDPASFEQIKKSLSTYLRGGYFITSEMGKNLWDRWLRGTMYLILLELSACNFEIASIEEIGIDSNGNEVLRTDSKELMYCSKITCRKIGEQNWRHVYYIRADLADSNKSLQNLLNFMSKRRFDTMFKSASYAIWDHTLSKSQELHLKNSRSILQDDTGMPFDCYRSGWSRYAFGSYTEPTLAVFKKVYKQPRMAEFFKKHSLASIPFKIGYGFTQCRPNLLLAVPKEGEQRSIDRDFRKRQTSSSSSSALPKKSQGKSAVAPVDKAGIMAQVEELKNLKLQYKQDENCESCGDKKDGSIKQYSMASGENQHEGSSNSSAEGIAETGSERKISNFSKSVAAIASEASKSSSSSLSESESEGLRKGEVAMETSSSEKQASKISSDVSVKVTDSDLGASAGATNGRDVAAVAAKVSPSAASMANDTNTTAELKAAPEAVSKASSKAKASDNGDKKGSGKEVSEVNDGVAASRKSAESREVGESANPGKTAVAGKSANSVVEPATSAGVSNLEKPANSEKSANKNSGESSHSVGATKSEKPANSVVESSSSAQLDSKNSAKIAENSVETSDSRKVEKTADLANFKEAENRKKSETTDSDPAKDTVVVSSEEDLEKRLAQVQV